MKKIKKLYIYIIIISIFFSALSFFINKKSIFEKDNYIKRNGYGSEKKKYNLKIDIGNIIKNKNIVFEVSKKRYKKDEIEEIFEYAFDDCMMNVLGDNDDFEHIETNLNFFKSYGEGIDVVWNFKLKNDDSIEKIKKYYKLVEENGKLNNSLIDEEYVEGYLEFYMKAAVEGSEKKVRSNTYSIPIIILPKEKNDEEVILEKLNKVIFENDMNDISTDYIKMPNKIDDLKIIYKEEKDFSFLFILFLGFVAIVVLKYKEKKAVKEKAKEKKKILSSTYSKLINKLLIYISSGMTIRNSICRIANDYKIKLDKKLENKNIVYEKLLEAKTELENGALESKVYEKLAKNFNDRKYNRFFNILIQNIKNGTKDFRNMLEVEAMDSLQEKKNNAKKMGEEAATKLIIPLLLELVIVMFVIIVPAFMGI